MASQTLALVPVQVSAMSAMVSKILAVVAALVLLSGLLSVLLSQVLAAVRAVQDLALATVSAMMSPRLSGLPGRPRPCQAQTGPS